LPRLCIEGALTAPEPRPGKDQPPPELSRSEEARRIIEEYSNELLDLRGSVAASIEVASVGGFVQRIEDVLALGASKNLTAAIPAAMAFFATGPRPCSRVAVLQPLIHISTPFHSNGSATKREHRTEAPTFRRQNSEISEAPRIRILASRNKLGRPARSETAQKLHVKLRR
jgi:hypothetical protein